MPAARVGGRGSGARAVAPARGRARGCRCRHGRGGRAGRPAAVHRVVRGAARHRELLLRPAAGAGRLLAADVRLGPAGATRHLKARRRPAHGGMPDPSPAPRGPRRAAAGPARPRGGAAGRTGERLGRRQLAGGNRGERPGHSLRRWCARAARSRAAHGDVGAGRWEGVDPARRVGIPAPATGSRYRGLGGCRRRRGVPGRRRSSADLSTSGPPWGLEVPDGGSLRVSAVVPPTPGRREGSGGARAARRPGPAAP